MEWNQQNICKSVNDPSRKNPCKKNIFCRIFYFFVEYIMMDNSLIFNDRHIAEGGI